MVVTNLQPNTLVALQIGGSEYFAFGGLVLFSGASC